MNYEKGGGYSLEYRINLQYSTTTLTPSIHIWLVEGGHQRYLLFLHGMDIKVSTYDQLLKIDSRGSFSHSNAYHEN